MEEIVLTNRPLYSPGATRRGPVGGTNAVPWGPLFAFLPFFGSFVTGAFFGGGFGGCFFSGFHRGFGFGLAGGRAFFGAFGTFSACRRFFAFACFGTLRRQRALGLPFAFRFGDGHRAGHGGLGRGNRGRAFRRRLPRI